MHRAHLAAHSQVFSDMFEAAGGDQGEPVPLTEPGRQLDSLFRFMYGRLTPDVTDWPTKQLLDVARTAKKYEVRAVTQIARYHIAYEYVMFGVPFPGSR